MITLLTDEDFNYQITDGLLMREPQLDLVRVQEVGLRGASDPVVLAWAAQEGRVLLTHDVTTMTHYATERMRSDLPMPGVFAVPKTVAVGRAIDELVILVECSLEGEWENQIRYVPL
jgi:hypothetical protein